MMTKLLDSNQDMSQRMTNMERRNLAHPPNHTARDNGTDTMTIRSAPLTEVVKDNESLVTIREVESDPSTEASKDMQPILDHSFDQDLKNSRPYTRASKRPPVWSVASSVVQTVSWSCFSGLSLADMSQISVINLPITPRELWNGQRYSACVGSVTSLDKIVEEESRCGSVSPAPSSSPSKEKSSSILNLKRLIRSPSPSSTISQKSIHSHRESGIPMFISKRIAVSGGYHSFGIKETPSLTDQTIMTGVSFSGRATIYNHLLMLYGHSVSESSRLKAREWIVKDLVDAFKTARVDLGRISPGVFFEAMDSEVCAI